jgi:predicted AlkP superfamily phosphohydrolase/phosphomutase
VIDPYDSVRTQPFEGVAVCGWQVTNRVSLPRWSAPAGVHRRLSRRLGRVREANETFGAPRLRELLRLRRVLLDASRRVAEAASALLAEGSFDLLWVELVTAHLAGHQLWAPARVVDMSGAGATDRRLLESALADAYEATDRALARVLELVPDDCDVIVMAGSGMTAETDRSDLLPGMLAAMLNGAPGAAASGRGRDPLWSVRAALPGAARERIARAIPDRAALEIAARLASSGNDWSRTRAFAVPNEPCGAVRLNLRGRERRGIVDSAEANDLMGEIGAGLLTFREPDGGPAVSAVERIDALEPSGPRSHLLPDLSVRWSAAPSTGLRFVESPAFGRIDRVGIGSGRSGNHSDEGWALLVPRRSSRRPTSGPARLVDVAATACAVLGADAELEALAGEPLLE